MARYKCEKVVQGLNGDVIAGANVSIYLSGTNTPATVYLTKDATSGVNTLPQLQTDSNGILRFWIDSKDYSYSQRFRIEVIKDNFSVVVDDVKIVEEEDILDLLSFKMQGIARDGWQVVFSYDQNGNLTGMEVKNSEGNIVATASFSYDANNNLSSESWNYGGRIFSYNYSYDEDLNLQNITVSVS